MTHLFLFTIGPVQSFIAQARKTQDLYAGSQILTELTGVAAAAAQKSGIRLIFPSDIRPDSPVPNRFIGKTLVNTLDADLQEIGHKVETAVQEHLDFLSKEALTAASISSTDERFWKQINSHLDINWLFYPIEGEGDIAYRTAYKAIEQEMASVKNLRILRQNREQGRKCSLDGERNALFFGKGTTNPKYLTQGQIVGTGGFWLNQNEGLSAVSFIKRGYRKGKAKNGRSFPSTAEIALLHEISAKKGIFDMYKACLGNDEFDAQLCYKENLTSKYLKKNGYADVLEKCPPSVLEKLRGEVFGSKELPKHYALIAFDGDKMGKILSGDVSIFKGNNLEEFQQAVSKRLLVFANEVHQYFETPENEKAGKVVYTGGDDFLGFVSLNSLFDVVSWLRHTFHQKVNKPLKEDGYFKDEVNFTFSAGIVMAHYKIPLSIVLAKAREMEEFAKHNGGRDAFAIAALKHSGESHQTCYNWVMEDGLLHWTALKNLVAFLEDKTCSESFARSVTREFYQLQNDDGKIQNTDMVKTELRRLIKRSMSPDKKDRTEEVYNCVEKLILSKQVRTGDWVKLETFTEALNVALFLKRVKKNQK